MKNLVWCLPALMLANQSFSQNQLDSLKAKELDEFVLKTIKVGENSPVAHEDFLKEDLEKIVILSYMICEIFNLQKTVKRQNLHIFCT